MSDIIISFDYSDIGALSDKTVRDFLKDVSKICRRAQARELDEVLAFLELEPREIQSLKDRIKSLSDGAYPTYYVHHITEGSLKSDIAFGGFIIWLLSATLGQTVTEAWKEAEIHKQIIEWVKVKRPTCTPKLIKEEAEKYDILSGRVNISIDIDSEAIASSLRKGEKIVIKVEMTKAPDAEIKDDSKIDASFVVQKITERLNELENK